MDPNTRGKWKRYIREAYNICRQSPIYIILDLNERYAAVKHTARMLAKIKEVNDG